MKITAPNFYRNLGLAGGSLWLIEVGAVFALWSLVSVHTGIATTMLTFLAIAAVALLIFGIRLMLMARRLSHAPEQDSTRGRRLLRHFGLIVLAEAVGCMLITLACSLTHHGMFIVPLNLIVVGLHFLPLARLFHVPHYRVTGILFCIFPAVTLLSVNQSAHIGHAASWIAIPAIGCGLVSLLSASVGLEEIRRFLYLSVPPHVWSSAARSVSS